jgi:hypothetical protein
MKSWRELTALKIQPRRFRRNMIIGHNLNETLRIKLVRKSFIFRVHEVLTRDNLTNWSRWFFVATNASTSASPCFVLVRRDSPAACARVLQVSPVLRRREIRDFGIQI